MHLSGAFVFPTESHLWSQCHSRTALSANPANYEKHTRTWDHPHYTHTKTHIHTHRRGQWCMRCSGGHALQVIQGLRRLGPGVADKRIAHIVMSLLVSVVTASSALDYTCVCVCVCVCVGVFYSSCMTKSASPASFWCIHLPIKPAAGLKSCCTVISICVSACVNTDTSHLHIVFHTPRISF